MQIAIIDDERIIVEEIARIISRIEVKNKLDEKLEVRIFTEADDFEYELSENGLYDLIFMDIELGTGNGIELAAKIRQLIPMIPLIFITGHQQYVYQVFQVHPFDFLLKPIEENQLEKTFMDIYRLLDRRNDFKYKKGGKYYTKLLKDIYWMRCMGRKIMIESKQGSDMFYGRMGSVEEVLISSSNSFMRINQSEIVNIWYITEYGADYVKMQIEDNEIMFRISRDYKQAIRKKYIELRG